VFSACATRKPWAEYTATAAADCNRKRRVIMSFPLDAVLAPGVGRIDANQAIHPPAAFKEIENV
jgi:hypothetical protein